MEEKINGNTGDGNTGDGNTGDWNTGHWNTGDGNAGDRNAGDGNTGHRNTGDWNTGHWNTGDWNTGHWNTGYFNTITQETIMAFNKPCPIIEWYNSIKPEFIRNIEISYWVREEDMTDEEKALDPNSSTVGGQLRKRSYKEAWKIAWDNTTQEDRDLVKSLPNFDPEVFFEISGIDLR